jgi:hypothetical protein
MAKHGIRANRRKAEPKATIQAEPTFYERTHPKGSAERFLDDAAKEALVAAAAGGVPTLRQFVPGAVRAAAKEAEKYPDPLLAEAARLPRDELLRRAAKAEAYQKAMEAQNATVDAVAAATSPVGNMVANQAGSVAHDALTRQDAKGGDAGHSGAAPAHAPNTRPHRAGGTRIVINPQVFKDKRDALCVAMNEGFRILMEANGFDPVSEPTEEQRRFFANTEYARDENMLRRTILARILTFDTSVTDPTESQLQECQEFLDSILEAGLVKTQWEQWAVRRIASLLFKVAPSPSSQPTAPADGPANADAGGGNAEEEKKAAATPTPAADSAPPADSATPTDVPTPTETPRVNDPAPDEAGQAPKDLSKFDETKEEHAQALKDAGHDPAAVMGQAPTPAGQAPAPAGQAPAPASNLQPPTRNEGSGSPTGRTTSATDSRREAIVAANGAVLDAMAKEHVAAANRTIESLDQHIKSAEILGKIVGNLNKSTDQILAQGEKILAETGKGEQAEEPLQKTASQRSGGGIDRSQFGQNGRIGIPARIVDPETGKSRSALSMNGPAIKPTRAIGDMGARTLTDTKRMNGPAIKPKRRIGEPIKAPEAREEELEELTRKRKKDSFG